MKDESTKQSKNGDNIVQPFSISFISTNPKLLKKCKENVNLMYHVYTITCKNNEKIY
jgi:hypothetical protein